MLAFVGTTVKKPEIMAQIQAHADADEIIKGQYWQDGKGCGVGCTIHSGDHAEYEPRFGIPQMLAHFEDCIFEGLPDSVSKEWPMRFMGAIKEGSDLSLVGWKFLHWMMTDTVNIAGIKHELVRDSVKNCADIIASLARGEEVDEASAVAAARATSKAAGGVWEAAISSAAWARSAEDEAAGWAARAAESMALSESAWIKMADKLISFIEDAPEPRI